MKRRFGQTIKTFMMNHSKIQFKLKGKMTQEQKINFYNRHQLTIQPAIKIDPETKPLWRRLFWTTARDSDQYKTGCVDIFKASFPDLFSNLINRNEE